MAISICARIKANVAYQGRPYVLTEVRGEYYYSPYRCTIPGNINISNPKTREKDDLR